MHSQGRGAVVAAAVVALAVVSLLGVPVADAGHAGELPSAGTETPPDGVLVRIAVTPDGSAVWHVEFRYRLSDENATAAFDTVRQDVESNPLTYTGPFAENMSRAVDKAATRTGREMAVRNVTVDATRRSVPETYGVVVYRFEWTAFAAVDDDRLRIGDALRGLFLAGEEQALQITWPDHYDAVEVAPDPSRRSDGAVTWRGRWDFAPGQPRVVIASNGVTETGRPAPSLIALGLLGVLALGLVGWYRLGAGSADATPTAGADGEPSSTGTPPDSAAGASDEGSAGDAPEDLLSDEERVVRLLEEHGGRMRQQAVVEAVDWSETKTSEVVKGLHEEGKIERYRLGRENVLALPGEIDV